ARFAGAEEWLTRPVDDVDLDLTENIREAQDGIATPVAGENVRAIERDRLVERPARRLNDAARDLELDPVGIDGLAAVGSGHGANEPDSTGLMLDLELDRDRAIGFEIILVSRECKTKGAPRRQLGVHAPAEFFGRQLDNVDRPLVVEMLQAEFDRIDIGRRGKLVHEAFDREHVRITAETAQRRDPDPLV